MNTRTLVTLSLFVAIGAALHFIMPGIFMGMKPDTMLAMMFLGIALFPDKKNVLLLGLATGLLAGITSTFPGGFVPNLIDKPISAFIFFGLYLLISKNMSNIIGVSILTAIGTLVSGTVFLTSAYLIVGLPGPFAALFGTVVIPAMIMNAVAMFVLFPIAKSILKRTNMLQEAS
ncbi:tryptophan transporter [Siminovitchia sediminis]|uniref:Tryptophan transporter n=1 Tax=Siminovitchia sediminis TaxID=1274353 RepID=A0ABW4KHD5_9BACI